MVSAQGASRSKQHNVGPRFKIKRVEARRCSSHTSFSVAQIIALCISVLNACYKVVSKKMTTFERHQTWKSYRCVALRR